MVAVAVPQVVVILILLAALAELPPLTAAVDKLLQEAVRLRGTV
jgi:hypothetical protein